MKLANVVVLALALLSAGCALDVGESDELTDSDATELTGSAGPALKYYGYYAGAWYHGPGAKLHMAFPEFVDHANMVDVNGNIGASLDAVKAHNDTNFDRLTTVVHTSDVVLRSGVLRTRAEVLAWWGKQLPVLRKHDAIITGFYLADEPYSRAEKNHSYEQIWEALSFAADTIKKDFPNKEIWLNYTPKKFASRQVQNAPFPRGVTWVSLTPDYGDGIGGSDFRDLKANYDRLKRKVLGHNNAVGRRAMKIVQFGDAFTYAGRKRDAASYVAKNELIFKWIKDENADGDLVDVVAYYPFIWRDFVEGQGLVSAPANMRASFRAVATAIVGEKFAITGAFGALEVVSGQVRMQGWACLKGARTTVAVHVYAGGPPGVGTFVGGAAASNPAEAAVAQRCQSGLSTHRFSFVKPLAELQKHSNQVLYAYGVAAGVTYARPALLANSTTQVIPALPGSATRPGNFPLYRYLKDGDAAHVDHWTTIEESVGAGYVRESTLGRTIYGGGANLQQLMSCVAGANHFVSVDPTCGGATAIGPLGQVYSKHMASTRPLYQCRVIGGADQFVTLDVGCEGHGSSAIVGYIPR